MSGAADIRGWARDVGDFVRDWPERGAERVQRSLQEQLRRDTGGDGALSRGRNLGTATLSLTAGDGEAEVSAAGSMAVWGILQGGTSAHEVRARPGRLLSTPYGPRPSVRVSGVRARRTFTEGADRGLDDAERLLLADWGRL